MNTKVTTRWIEGYSFDSEVDGFTIRMDISKEAGGNNTGPRPKPLLLTALSGCSGMDVVGFLAKMRVKNYTFSMEADAVICEDHPKVYKSIRLKYKFTGDDLPLDKVVKAVELSRDKYCAVSAMLRNAMQITNSIEINGVEVWNDKNN